MRLPGEDSRSAIGLVSFARDSSGKLVKLAKEYTQEREERGTQNGGG